MSISALACRIAERRSSEEIALISSIYSQLGDILNTVAAYQTLYQFRDSEKREDSGKPGGSGQPGSSGQTNHPGQADSPGQTGRSSKQQI